MGELCLIFFSSLLPCAGVVMVCGICDVALELLTTADDLTQQVSMKPGEAELCDRVE